MNTRMIGGIGIVLAACVLALSCAGPAYRPIVVGGPVAAAIDLAEAMRQPFYDDLAPYGRWVFVAGPGWVWSPFNVAAGWRPYLYGHWVFTDHGWTWASDEEWGWAVYHYGRWHRDPGHGWVWVPGTEWGPAWVAWHEGAGWVGWAPLPWQVAWRAGIGLDWGGVNVSLDAAWWQFVEARHLVSPGLRSHVAPFSRNLSLIRITRNVTSYTYVDNRVVNQGVRVEAIGKAVGRVIPRLRLLQADAPEAPRGGKVKGSEFLVFRPKGLRGRPAQDRLDPPGRDERDRPRGPRPHTIDPEPSVAPPPQDSARDDREAEPAPADARPDDASAEDRPNPAPAAAPQDRKRKFVDHLLNRQQPRHPPREAGPARPEGPEEPAPPPQAADPARPSSPARPAEPAQPASPARPGAPGQPAGQGTSPASPARPATPAAPSGKSRPEAPAAPATARPGGPASGNEPGAATAPARTPRTKPQDARGKAKGPKDAAAKPAKPKPDAPESEDSKSEDSKQETPESED